jgi:hypothetical protein
MMYALSLCKDSKEFDPVKPWLADRRRKLMRSGLLIKRIKDILGKVDEFKEILVREKTVDGSLNDERLKDILSIVKKIIEHENIREIGRLFGEPWRDKNEGILRRRTIDDQHQICRQV